ncbi:faciogenital dysplasia protein [Anaeramoeba ignava]|uniref:Faciogenital dysplasia protein n=1 Tax=Anaeramoeba ignava TaxID=1746090 RepID=A0A9Q0LF61_ANAIG|nr:faciogenital dysplasia protein [Anaeramoeba ignava]
MSYPEFYFESIKIQKVFRGYLSRKFVLSDQFSKERNKNHFIQELILTEKNYVNHLRLIIEIFLIPIQKKKILSEAAIKAIFSEVQPIYELNKRLYDKLSARRYDLQKTSFGDVFLEFVPFMRFYSVYVNNYNTSMTTFSESLSNHKFSKFLQQAYANSQLDKLSLPSLLITPVQRIPRYVLLVEGIVKNTDPKNPDYELFSKVHKEIQGIATEVNKKKEEYENMEKLIEIRDLIRDFDVMTKTGRKFILQGPLFLEGSKKPDKGWGFLFNDCLLLTTKGGDNKYTTKLCIKLHEVTLKVNSSVDCILSSRTKSHSICSNDSGFFKNMMKNIRLAIKETKSVHYDSINWKFVPVKGLKPKPISKHQSCLFNNKMYVFGGEIKENDKIKKLNSIYEFDLISKTWQLIQPKGIIPEERSWHTMSKIGYLFYVFGGEGNNDKFNDLHIFDPIEFEWKLPTNIYGDLPCTRSGHSSSVIGDQMWIMGGRSISGDFLNDLYCLVTTPTYECTWYPVEYTGQTPHPRAWHTATFFDSQLIIIGGSYYTKYYNDVWVYDIDSNNFYEADIGGVTLKPRFGHSASIVGDRIWVIGGQTALEFFTETIVLDFNQAKWVFVNELGDAPAVISKHTSLTIEEDNQERVMVFGGSSYNYSNEIYIMDPNFKKLNFRVFSHDFGMENRLIHKKIEGISTTQTQMNLMNQNNQDPNFDPNLDMNFDMNSNTKNRNQISKKNSYRLEHSETEINSRNTEENKPKLHPLQKAESLTTTPKNIYRGKKIPRRALKGNYAPKYEMHKFEQRTSFSPPDVSRPKTVYYAQAFNFPIPKQRHSLLAQDTKTKKRGKGRKRRVSRFSHHFQILTLFNRPKRDPPLLENPEKDNEPKTPIGEKNVSKTLNWPKIKKFTKPNSLPNSKEKSHSKRRMKFNTLTGFIENPQLLFKQVRIWNKKAEDQKNKSEKVFEILENKKDELLKLQEKFHMNEKKKPPPRPEKRMIGLKIRIKLISKNSLVRIIQIQKPFTLDNLITKFKHETLYFLNEKQEKEILTETSFGFLFNSYLNKEIHIIRIYTN